MKPPNKLDYFFNVVGLVGGCTSGFTTYKVLTTLVSPSNLFCKIIFKTGSLVISNAIMNWCYKDLLKTERDFYNVHNCIEQRKDCNA